LDTKLESIQLTSGEVKQIPTEFLDRAFEQLVSRSKNRRGVEVMLKRGFQFDTKGKRLVIPLAFLQQDATIAQIMLSCAHLLGYSVMVYEDSKLNCNIKNGFDDFFLGLLYAIGGPRNTKLSHSKLGRELAYSIGMSIRMKGEARRWNLEGALRPNNFFFANNPTEAVVISRKRTAISYGVKNAFLAPFESVAAGTIFYKIVSSALMQVGIQDMSVEVGDLFFFSNIITFDDFVKKNWVEIYAEKGKKLELVQVRKATFPSRNALLLNEELDIIKLWTSPFFSSVEDLRKDYFNLLMTHGFAGFNALVSQRFGIRHTILQNIASVTTKRLQALRKTEASADIKKKQVTREKLVSYLSKIPSPLMSFRSELEKLLNQSQRQIAYSILGAQLGVDAFNVMDHLLSKILPVYVNQNIYKESEKGIGKQIYKPDDLVITLYETVYKKATSVKNTRNLIIDLMKKVSTAVTPEYRGMLYRKIYNLCDSVITKVEECRQAENEKYKELVKNLQITLTLFDGITLIDTDKNNYIYDFCRDFKACYLKTSMYSTLNVNEDSSMKGLIQKAIDSQRQESIPFFNF
jgi:hypothetical protein